VGFRPGPATGDAAVEFFEPPHHFLTDALAHLFFAADDVADNQQHQPAGPEPAEMAVPLDQRDLGTSPPGGKGGNHARWSAADNQHVGLVQQRQFALRLNNLAVDHNRR
jgi:hypothetical protein